MNHNPKQCQYCGVHYHQLRDHEAGCLKNPVYWQHLVDFLHKHQQAGFMISLSMYRRICVGNGLPTANSLVQEFGSWSALAAAVGLHERPEGTNVTKACQHCGVLFMLPHLGEHEAHCPKEPERYARLFDFVNSILIGGRLPLQAEYARQQRDRQADVPLVADIVKVWGSWTKFAKEMGVGVSVQSQKGKVYDRTAILLALREWFDANEPPYHRVHWDAYAATSGLLNSGQIYKRWPELSWDAIVLIYEGERYPIRDDEKLAAEYVGLGFQATRCYEAVYSRGGQRHTETRFVLR